MKDRVIVKKEIEASQKEIFEAWLDPELLSRFMIPMEGTSCESVQIDKKIGGSFSLTMVIGETKIPVNGIYKKIEEFSNLVFSWNSPATNEGSQVELEISELSSNKSLVKLSHSGLTSHESRENHEKGWGLVLDYLSKMNQ